MCDHHAVPIRDLEQIRRGESPQVAQGFSSELFCGEAEAFVRSRSRTRPFFACVALTSPHDPRTPPAEFRALYDPEHIPLPASFQAQHSFDNGELAVRDEQLAASPRNPAEVQRHLADYYGMISHHDACLGRLFGALRETGDEENALVVYVSDHGLALGGHGLMGKQNLYEHSRRVPLILRGPGIPRGRQCAALAYSLDLYATICAVAGINPPEGLESRSLLPALVPGAPPLREELGALYMDCQRMMMDGRWKLIVYQVKGSVRVQLFDLANDPDELADQAHLPESQPIIARLRSRLDAWQRHVGDQWMHLPGAPVASP
jgi:arylsulfatase A-like enzyme